MENDKSRISNIPMHAICQDDPVGREAWREVEIQDARCEFAKKYGIESVAEGEVVVVNSLSQALLAERAGYVFELKIQPLDECLGF